MAPDSALVTAIKQMEARIAYLETLTMSLRPIEPVFNQDPVEQAEQNSET